MPKLLAVERMTDAELWAVADRELYTLSNLVGGEESHVSRRGRARKARECLAELKLRGQQLQFVTYGSDSK